MRASKAEIHAKAPSEQEQQLKRAMLACWEQDRARLLVQQPFVALLAMRLELVLVVDSRLPSACTDGRTIFTNAHFLWDLSESERLFVLGHEVWHCAARHLLRRGRRTAGRWNVAADHEVNALLKEEGMQLPADCVYFPALHGANAETVYQSAACEQWAWENGRGRLADVHDMNWQYGATERVHDPDFDVFNPRFDGAGWPERIVAAAQQLEHQQGTLPAGIARLVAAHRRPQLPWRVVLADFTAQACGGERSWLPPHRRSLAQGLYLPSRRTPQLDIAVAIDTSASTADQLQLLLAELLGIMHSFGRYQLRLLLCDAAVHGDAIYTDTEPLDPEAIRIKGGGGTLFAPVFERLAATATPPALIYLTDGHGPAPEQPPHYPVLWVLTPGGRRPARWGRVLELSRDSA